MPQERNRFMTEHVLKKSIANSLMSSLATSCFSPIYEPGYVMDYIFEHNLGTEWRLVLCIRTYNSIILGYCFPSNVLHLNSFGITCGRTQSSPRRHRLEIALGKTGHQQSPKVGELKPLCPVTSHKKQRT